MPSLIEYEFTLPDGSKRYEMVAERREVCIFQKMHGAIRAALGSAGATTRILYGGSVSPDNAAEILALEDVDGGLVGGASLSAAKFVPIIAAAAALA